MQININNNFLDVKENNFLTGQISSLYMKNYKTILITDDNYIQILNNPNNDSFFCNIF